MAPRLNFLPGALSQTLLDFQQEGVLFGISKNGRCLIGDEMGLGKTLQALSIAYYYKNEWPLLIVCPSSMRFPWIEEIEKWLPDIEPHELNLVQSCADASNLKTSKISIIGYGLLSHPSSRLLINCLKEIKFGVVIVDESHYMKNRKAARTKALVWVIKQAKRAVLLTGTPALARPEELFVQIDVLQPNLLGSFSKFANRYCDAHTEHVCGGKIQRWNTKGASNLEELHNVLKSNVMIRRLKRKVLTQLPPKCRQRIAFDLAESESKKELDKVIVEFKSVCKQIKEPSASQNLAEMGTNPLFEMGRLTTVLYKQTGLSKIPAVRQYIADILDNSDKKFLVFAHHVDVMKAIELEVVKKRVKYIRIAGDVPSVLRGSLVHQFQTDSSTRVAILSILAASVGITLTAADHIIFSELHWTPGVMEQAEDRVHRIGQENSVLVQYLVARGTIDEVLWRMLCNKVYVTTTTLNGKLQGLDVEEGSESQSKLLEAFSAWVMEDEDDEVSEDDFLFTHSQKKRKHDSLQRSLTEFFHSPSTTKCRKTDSGKQWSETQDSSSQEQDCEADQDKVQSVPETETCIVVESDDEDNSLRKTTRKTYKLGKRKSLEITEQTAAVQASESQEIAWEFAREMTTIDADETSEPASSEVVDMLSSYTRLLNKAKNQNLGDICQGNKVDTRIESLPKSGRENSLNLVDSSEESRQQLADKEESVVNGCLTENGHQTATATSCMETTGNDKSETEPTVSLNSIVSKHNSCSEESTVAVTNELAVDSDNTAPDVRHVGAKNELNSDSVESKDTQVLLVPTSAENINDFKTWCCSLCTFKNNDFLRVCEVCETPRYKSRRKSTNKNCSTDEFVARKQQKILEKCSGVEQKKCGRRNGGKRSKKSSKGSVAVSRGNEECTRTQDTISILVSENVSEECTSSSSVERLLDVKTEVQGKPEIPVKPDVPVTSTEILVKPEMPVKSVESCELNTSDIDLFSCAQPNKEVSEEIRPSPDKDEIMTSSCEDKIITSPCMSDRVPDLFGTESEFDDITDDDWWMCTSCKNYNYEDAADRCEACGHVKKPSEHFDDLVTGLEVDDDCWRCEDCGEFNFGDDVIRKCTKCSHGDKKGRKSLVELYRNLRHLIVDDEEPGGTSGTSDEKNQEQSAKQEAIENLMFRPSSYTDRVYLYDGTGEPLNCNVNVLEIDDSNTENTPVLLTEPLNRKQILKFVKRWKSLQQRDRRMIRKAGVIFDNPHEALGAIKMGREQKVCTSRFPSKEKLQAEVLETAQERNGTVRHCVKPKGRMTGGCSVETKRQEDVSGAHSQNTRWMQAVDEHGRPLCLSCKGVVDTKNTNSLWDERFCSHKCKEHYQCRINGNRVRQQLFQDEKGVCQKCGCDAHELYRTAKLLPKADRRSFLEKTPFISLPVSVLNRIIIDPKEGMFWEADHVVAVVEGGGECDLENYRTLCVPCHRQVTAELNERLRANRRKRRIAGIPDITSFFSS